MQLRSALLRVLDGEIGYFLNGYGSLLGVTDGVFSPLVDRIGLFDWGLRGSLS